MTRDADTADPIAEQVREAATNNQPLAIRGQGTKRFYTGELPGTALEVSRHRGIVNYEPTELVITARAGTPLTEIETVLAGSNQMLGFEPPHFGDGATLGGTLACGFSGPRRPYAGSARDFVLGMRVINGQGEILKFGGQVMKNVAGFDASRLMVGSLGTLGVMLDVSLKVLPRPDAEITLRFEMPAKEAIRSMNTWAGQPLPLSGAAYGGDILYLRLSGTESGVRAARARLGGDALEKAAEFWDDLREHRRSFFTSGKPLWRLSVPPATPPIELSGKWLLDWGGAQRWLVTDLPATTIDAAAESAGGQATRFANVVHRFLNAATAARLQSGLRTAFDPHRIFNPRPAH